MTENVFLFVPNIIDYLRIVFAFVSFYFMPTSPGKATCFYLLSGFLDVFDGHAARMLNQGSKLGAMLDQLIDRITTMCLCAALCHFYPQYMLLLQFSMALDIFSHWFHLQSSLMKGSTSHKMIDVSAHPILKHYYHDKIILFIFCSANELFYCLLYVVYFTSGPILPLGPLSIGLWKLLLFLSAPISIMKSCISLLQLITACQNVAAIDVAEREKAKQELKNK